jgi:hypothetical protein
MGYSQHSWLPHAVYFFVDFQIACYKIFTRKADVLCLSSMFFQPFWHPFRMRAEIFHGTVTESPYIVMSRTWASLSVVSRFITLNEKEYWTHIAFSGTSPVQNNGRKHYPTALKMYSYILVYLLHCRTAIFVHMNKIYCYLHKYKHKNMKSLFRLRARPGLNAVKWVVSVILSPPFINITSLIV